MPQLVSLSAYVNGVPVSLEQIKHGIDGEVQSI